MGHQCINLPSQLLLLSLCLVSVLRESSNASARPLALLDLGSRSTAGELPVSSSERLGGLSPGYALVGPLLLSLPHCY